MTKATGISIACVAMLLGTGCGDDAEPDAMDSTETAEPSGGPGTEGSDGTTVDATPSADDESSTGEQPSEGVLAEGIVVDTVEINQGVGITLAQEGALIPVPQRVAPVIAGRGALVRASYQLDPGFVPRTIVGRLWLHNGLDDDFLYTEERMVTGPGDWSTLDGTFHWFVEADDLTDETEFRVQLLELDEDAEPPADAEGAELPADDFAALEAWGDPMVVELVLVPFSCAGYPELVLDPADLDDFEAYLFNTMAVQELVLTVHDPVPSNDCSEFTAAEVDLPALREAEGAEPWVYYGGLLPGDGGGYSISIEDSDQMDFRRTFANHAWRDYGLTADLFAHELGHNHGRDHTFEDPGFPGSSADQCGMIETYGWGPRSALMPSSGYSNDLDLGLDWFDPSDELLLPTVEPCGGQPDGNRYNFNDMMSYVYPFWVSAYTYATMAERIRLITSWSTMAQPPSPPGQTLRLVLGPEADVHRMIVPGSRPVDEPDAWALCGQQRLPVRANTSWLERPRVDGGLERFAYLGFELPLSAEIDPSDCRLEYEGTHVPFTRP